MTESQQPIDLRAPAIVFARRAIWFSRTSAPDAVGTTLTAGPDVHDEFWNIPELETELRDRVARGAQVNVFADSRESGNLLKRVLFSAEQAHVQVRMVVKTPQGRGGVGLTQTRSYTKRPTHRCVLPVAEVTPNGWVPVARDVDEAGGGEVDGLSDDRPLTRPVWSWSGHPLLLDHERCPTPLKHLSRFADALRSASDLCPDSVVAFGDDVGVGVIATAVAHFAVGNAAPVELYSTSNDQRPWDPCSGALPSVTLADRTHQRTPPPERKLSASESARMAASLREAFGAARGPVEVLPPAK